jgi:HEPN domain-containing protein
MNPLTAEWIAKAEADYEGAVSLRRRRKALPDLVCFHCQQCAEKYLKAFLQDNAIPFPKTHVLEDLLRLATASFPKMSNLVSSLMILEDYSVKFRYPGVTATISEATDAMKAVRFVRKNLRQSLGIKSPKQKRKKKRTH